VRSGALLNQIESVIRAVLDECAHAKFLLKYCTNALKPETEARLSPDLRARGVELIPSEQSHADHIGTIERSDVVFLPYEATEYTALASGLFAEAAALGKVIVYPAGTWMAEEVARDRAAGVDFSVADLRQTTAAVLRALDSLSELSSAACARSQKFRALHSCGQNLDLMLALAAEEHDMSTGYVPGTPVRFDKPVQARGYMGHGWSSFEAAGVWTEGPVAELAFCIEPRPASPLEARFRLTPFFSKCRPQRITISVGGVTLGEWSFPDDGKRTPGWCSVMIPANIMANEPIRMLFHVKDPHSPNQAGESDDSRALGFMLHEMCFDPLDS
jgi:hypothetical protein